MTLVGGSSSTHSVVLATRSTGDVRDPQANLAVRFFAATMFGRCLRFKATNPDLDWSERIEVGVRVSRNSRGSGPSPGWAGFERAASSLGAVLDPMEQELTWQVD